ncbi:hypothetical protein ZWY2020_018759 [Hordeum vulgare]|nr:hypothetical protein ZWY2020_018759 [Hordeum vulgare]
MRAWRARPKACGAHDRGERGEWPVAAGASRRRGGQEGHGRTWGATTVTANGTAARPASAAQPRCTQRARRWVQPGAAGASGEHMELAAASTTMVASKRGTLVMKWGSCKARHGRGTTRPLPAGPSANGDSCWVLSVGQLAELTAVSSARRLGRARVSELHHGHHVATTVASRVGAARPWRGSSAAGTTASRGSG